MKTNTEQIIMGIDPGTNVMGYGIIRVVGNEMKLLNMNVVNLSKEKDAYLKLRKIFNTTLELIDEYHPDELAIEAQFFGKNVQSMLKLGRAQGTSIAAAISRDIPVAEYMPKRVKQAVTGNGNASKEQVAGMLGNILGFEQSTLPLDATDGLAVAVCHHLQAGKPTLGGKKFSGWKAFVSQNPDRTK